MFTIASDFDNGRIIIFFLQKTDKNIQNNGCYYILKILLENTIKCIEKVVAYKNSGDVVNVAYACATA